MERVTREYVNTLLEWDKLTAELKIKIINTMILELSQEGIINPQKEITRKYESKDNE